MITDEEIKDALCKNDIVFLKKNLHKDLDINYRFEDDDYDTLIHYSISDAGTDVYKTLLNYSPDLNALNSLGESFLHAAVYSDKKERIETLLHLHDYNINQKSNDGTTPLLLSVVLKKYNVIESLIKLGADVNLTDNQGIAPLHMASEFAPLKIIKLLIENGSNLIARTNQGNLPLALAVNNNKNKDVIDYLYSQYRMRRS